MKDVEIWFVKAFPGAKIDPFGSHQGQIRFEIPISTRHQENLKRDVRISNEDIIAVAGIAEP